MIIKKRGIIFTGLVLLLLLIILAGAQPLSEGDPLVTKSWVLQYVDNAFSPLDKQMSTLKEDWQGGRIEMWIGRSLALAAGEEKTLDVAPVIYNGRTMVPLRFLGENLGVKVSWVQEEGKVTYASADKTIELWLNKKEITVNGVKQTVDCGIIMSANRTLAPVRLLAESFGYTVYWQPATKKVVVFRP